MGDQHHIGHGGFSPYVLTGGTSWDRQSTSIPPEDLVYARKSEIDRLKRIERGVRELADKLQHSHEYYPRQEAAEDLRALIDPPEDNP